MAARTYQLTVEGELGDLLESSFAGMTFTRGEGTTTLTGDLRDQAELQGVLQRVSDFGLILLEARAIDHRLEGRTGNESAAADARSQAPSVPENPRRRR